MNVEWIEKAIESACLLIHHDSFLEGNIVIKLQSSFYTLLM
jgi:hypothetical protein